MATGANFTQITTNRPSIFDILASRSLNDTLYPALKRLTSILNEHNWLTRYFDELFLGLNLLTQYYYLKKYDATFSEHFYGLKRVLKAAGNLNDKHRLISLLFIVVIPYLQRKFNEKINDFKLQKVDGCLRQNFTDNLKKLLIFSHSTFELIWNLLIITNYISYMANNTNTQLPTLKLIGMKLVYNQQLPTQFWSLLFSGKLKQIQLNDFLIGNLEVFAFFLQFLQVWNTEKHNLKLTRLPTVPAPQFDEKAKNYNGKCPLCLQNWKIATVLPVSGYVFCFRCILTHLQMNQKCPITNLPAKPLDLIRLYDE